MLENSSGDFFWLTLYIEYSTYILVADFFTKFATFADEDLGHIGLSCKFY